MADREWLLRHEVTGWFSKRCGRAQASHLAADLGRSRKAIYDACLDLHEQRLLIKRTDPRGRVWFTPRPGADAFVDSRKSRIVTALAASSTHCRRLNCALRSASTNSVRGYEVLHYYRAQGLIESVEAQPGREARWSLRRDDGS
jgi:hypothetical protein